MLPICCLDRLAIEAKLSWSQDPLSTCTATYVDLFGFHSGLEDREAQIINFFLGGGGGRVSDEVKTLGKALPPLNDRLATKDSQYIYM